MTKDTKRKYATCEHDYVGYKELHRLVIKQHNHIKKLNKALDKLGERLSENYGSLGDCLEKNQGLYKANIELTRAYNGLHTMGKFAQELGIDIKKHNDLLPENNKEYEFEQEHKLLESGKVKHIYKLKKKKKKRDQDGDTNE